MADAVKWVATMSDGTTVAEGAGKFQQVPGERKPWVQLTRFLAENKLHLTSLRLNINGRTIHMPRSNFDRFGMNDVSATPNFYSLQYHHEAEMEMGGLENQTSFVDLAAHYDHYTVHYIQDVTDGDKSWIVITEGDNPMAPTPRRT